VRPEVRVLSPAELPPAEWPEFVSPENRQVLKAFKGYGAWYSGLSQAVALTAGDYVAIIEVFPDLVDRYEDGQKVWATDSRSARARVLVDGQAATDWAHLIAGSRVTLLLPFTTDGGNTVRFEFMLPFPLNNAGLFVSRLDVERSEPIPPGPPPAGCRGAPRAQYERTYNVIPGDVTETRAVEIFLEGWRRSRETAGGSYDDAGVGDLDERIAILHDIPLDLRPDFVDFYETYYPGVEVRFPGAEPPPPPPPPPPSTTNKLGPHILRATPDIALTYNAPVVKLVGDWGLADRYEGLVIGRQHNALDAIQGEYDRGRTPRQAAEDFMALQLDVIRDNPLIEYWEGPNEPVFAYRDGIGWYAEFEIERINLLAALNKRAVIANFATGWPADLEWWQDFLPAIEYGLQHGALLGLHEYSCPWMWWMTGAHQIDPDENEGDEGWTTLRYRKIYRQHLAPAGFGTMPLVITETGIDPGVNPRPPGTPAGTWRQLGDFWRDNDGRPDTAQYYYEQLKWYENELQKDPYVIGATVYCVGNYGPPWDAFDIAGTEVLRLLGTDWGTGTTPPPEPPALEIIDVRYQLATNPASPWYPWKTRAMSEITHFFVHHSAGALSSSYSTVEAINNFHISPSGKNRPGICYTFVIGADGTIWYVSDITNVVFAQGSESHPGDENRFGVAACLLGNFTAGREPTAAQMDSLEKLIAHVEKLLGRSIPVWGHKDVIATACPGDSWPWKPEWGKQPAPPPLTATLRGYNDHPGATGTALEWLNHNGKSGLIVRPIFLGGTGSILNFPGNQRVVVNLRYSWAKDNGGAGTLPLPGTPEHAQFVDAAIYTINNSPGVFGWEIGNEYNNPREFPTTGDLTPQSVAQTYNAIRAGCPGKRLGVGALDPFNAQAGDPRNWLTAIYGLITGAELVFAHGYIRGPDASLVGSQAKFADDPLRWQYLNYPGCITALLAYLPAAYKALPVYITEFNHLWKTVEPDWGWVNDGRAADVITAAISAAQVNGFAGLAIYRWAGDEWAVEHNDYVKGAVL